MTPAQILDYATAHRIRIEARAGKVILEAESGPLPAELVEAARRNKPDLLRILGRAQYWLLHYPDGRQSPAWAGVPVTAAWLLGQHPGAARAEPLREWEFLQLLDVRAEARH